MNEPNQQRTGVLYGLAAFGFWGFGPVLYFKVVREVTPLELLGHRILWALPLLALFVTVSRDWKRLVAAIWDRKTFLTLVLSATTIALNWLGVIYAVVTERVLQGSLGFFISPLCMVFLGRVFLRERLTRLQKVALGFVLVGTTNHVFSGSGGVPWIAVALALSGAVYGLLRKMMRIDSVNGLFVETCLLFPWAIGYLLWLASRGLGSFGFSGLEMSGLLMLAGPVTSIPLIWFASAARRLRYTTIGFFQYISPSLQFLLAVFLFREPFTLSKGISFAIIWVALGIFCASAVVEQRRESGRSPR